MNSMRSSEVFPEPEGPVRKWKEPGRRWKEMSRSTSRLPSYFNPMPFNLITLAPGLLTEWTRTSQAPTGEVDQSSRNVADWCCGNAIARCRIRGMSSSSVPFPWACSVRQVAEGGGVRPEDARHPPDAVGLAGRQQERLAARVAALAQESR